MFQRKLISPVPLGIRYIKPVVISTVEKTCRFNTNAGTDYKGVEKVNEGNEGNFSI